MGDLITHRLSLITFSVNTPAVSGPGAAKAKSRFSNFEPRSSPHLHFDVPSPKLTSDFCPLTSEKRRRFSAFTLPKLRERSRAFTLMEMLTVIGIISILLVLLVPAFTTRKSADDVTSAANSIKGLLETARTYAKANNTYVFVGLAEVKASVDSSGPQQAGNGRVAVAAVASKDGTRHFQYLTSGQGTDWTANYNTEAFLVAVGTLQVYENLHFALLNFGPWTATLHLNSNMARSQLGSGASYNLGTSPNSVTPFDWPLGSPLNSGKYRFKKVINFDPQGVARAPAQGEQTGTATA